MKIEDGWVYFDHTECERFSPKLEGDQYMVCVYSSREWSRYINDFRSPLPRNRNFDPLDTTTQYRRPLSLCTPEQLRIEPTYEHYL